HGMRAFAHPTPHLQFCFNSLLLDGPPSGKATPAYWLANLLTQFQAPSIGYAAPFSRGPLLRYHSREAAKSGDVPKSHFQWQPACRRQASYLMQSLQEQCARTIAHAYCIRVLNTGLKPGGKCDETSAPQVFAMGRRRCCTAVRAACCAGARLSDATSAYP